MNKDQFEDLVLNYCYAIYDDMSKDELRSYIINILYQEKSLLTPKDLLEEIKNKYPEHPELYNQ